MMFEFNMAELLRHRWGRLRLYRFLGSVLTDYRILKNYGKTLTGTGV
ncbi:YlcG family protein [Escherichia coli]|nr:YlcG family protein [Escherichia coli]